MTTPAEMSVFEKVGFVAVQAVAVAQSVAEAMADDGRLSPDEVLEIGSKLIVNALKKLGYSVVVDMSQVEEHLVEAGATVVHSVNMDEERPSGGESREAQTPGS